MSWSLFWRFALISLLAVGGGATVPLVERISVRHHAKSTTTAKLS